MAPQWSPRLVDNHPHQGILSASDDGVSNLHKHKHQVNKCILWQTLTPNKCQQQPTWTSDASTSSSSCRCTAAGRRSRLTTTTPMSPSRVPRWPNGTRSSPSSRLWQLRAEFAERGNRSVRHWAPIGTSDWHEHVSLACSPPPPRYCRVDLLFMIMFWNTSPGAWSVWTWWG